MKTKTEGIVVRSCSILSTSDSCNTVELFGVKSEACTCTADLCNSAQTMTSSYVIVVVSVLAFLTKIAKF
ncbi:hypothetical protein DPMN_194282 [Dreissena polymorpha]|uniref:Protein sleepless n=2 Tax=Dreissena polymorpha TaxID=45954 RepID=A0A9D3Y5V7_DREPO|nr:hypothetical protein DPMN_194282 [Dreissena polymorpha]